MSLAEQPLVAPPRWLRGELAATVNTPAGSKAGAATERLPFLDFLRAVSAHVIVWHHLMLYGPLADAAAELAPAVSGGLVEYGPNAVQVFLVISGFLTARGLTQRVQIQLSDCWSLLCRRYLRIAGPYLCVLAVAIAANWLADRWMDDESISAFPSISQILAHSVFLHDLLGYEALSAGVWYLAIDFQLAMAAVAGWWASSRVCRAWGVSSLVAAQVMIWPLAVISLVWINRLPAWDVTALYFFGSYALGMITGWVTSGKLPQRMFWVYAALVVCALAIEFRPRLAVALATGLLILGAAGGGWMARFPASRLVLFAGTSSYSLFLIHFPVCLLVNAWLATRVQSDPQWGAVGLIAAYVLSVLASVVFYFSVERRFAMLRA